MTNQTNIYDPFPSENWSLKDHPPTREQKLWIVRKIDSGDETSYSVARRLGCKADYIRRVRSRVKAGRFPRGKCGRPPVIDMESAGKLRAEIAANPALTYDDAVGLLDQEYASTMMRTYPKKYEEHAVARKRLKLASSTRVQYMNVFFPHLLQDGENDGLLADVNIPSNIELEDNWFAEF